MDPTLYQVLIFIFFQIWRSVLSINVVSYEVIFQVTLNEEVKARNGKIPLVVEERAVIEIGNASSGNLTWPDTVAFYKLVDSTTLGSLKMSSSGGFVTWTREESNDHTVHEGITRIKVMVHTKNIHFPAILFNFKWRTLKEMHQSNPHLPTRIFSKMFIYFPYLASGDAKLNTAYNKTSFSVVTSTPRMNPSFDARVKANIKILTPSEMSDQSGEKMTISSICQRSLDHSYGGSDVRSYLCERIQSFRKNLPIVHGIYFLDVVISITNISDYDLIKYRKTPNIWGSDDCPLREVTNYVSVPAWSIMYCIYLPSVWMFFYIDSRFLDVARKSEHIFKIIISVTRVLFACLLACVFVLLYANSKIPRCMAVHSGSLFKWIRYLFWTVFPSLSFILLFWPYALNVELSKQRRLLLDVRNRLYLKQILKKSLAVPLIMSVVVFHFRILVTDIELMNHWLGVMTSLVVTFAIWTTRRWWRVDTKTPSNEAILASTLSLPVLIGLKHVFF